MLSRYRPRFLRGAAVGLLLLLPASPRAFATITCEEVTGPPGPTSRVAIEILTPDAGAVVVPTAACGQLLTVTGRFEVSGPPVLHDLYVIVDRSGSASADSGADVDGDTILGEAEDSIYVAELTAAQALVRALDPAYARVAIIVFNRDAVLEHALSADMASVDARLEALKADRPRWGTRYVDAMQAVLDERVARGDPATRVQRGVFLSDGVPDETLPVVHAKALELAAVGIVMDTFALGAINSNALEDIAATTNGRFTALATPGDIVAALPSFVPTAALAFDARNETVGGLGNVIPDEAAGTLEASVWLLPGDNHLVLELEADFGVVQVRVSCAIDVTLLPTLLADAGPDVRACGDGGFLLSGLSSTLGPCMEPTFRWLDCEGVEIGATAEMPVAACGPCTTYTLEIGCVGEACTAADVVAVECLKPPTLSPAAQDDCALSARLDCGAVDPDLDLWWDLDVAVDSDGNGDPEDDVDAVGCQVGARWPDSGPREVKVSAVNPGGCAVEGRLLVIVPPAPAARQLDGGACPGRIVLVSGAGPSASCWWDLEALVDTEGDGDPTNDFDALGCDLEVEWLAEATHDVVAWTEDPPGCRVVLAAGRIDVSVGAAPGEAARLMLSHGGDELTLSWDAAVGAGLHVVSRGSLASLWSRRAYDHAADEPAGRGACALGRLTFVDPDDAALGEDAYYLVTARNPCAGEGSAGWAWDGRVLLPRPARIPTASCP